MECIDLLQDYLLSVTHVWNGQVVHFYELFIDKPQCV